MIIIRPHCIFFFFFNDTATTEIYTLSLHDALPILSSLQRPDRTASPHQGVARENAAGSETCRANPAGVSSADPPREHRLAARRACELSGSQEFPLGAPRRGVDNGAESYRGPK